MRSVEKIVVGRVMSRTTIQCDDDLGENVPAAMMLKLGNNAVLRG